MKKILIVSGVFVASLVVQAKEFDKELKLCEDAMTAIGKLSQALKERQGESKISEIKPDIKKEEVTKKGESGETDLRSQFFSDLLNDKDHYFKDLLEDIDKKFSKKDDAIKFINTPISDPGKPWDKRTILTFMLLFSVNGCTINGETYPHLARKWEMFAWHWPTMLLDDYGANLYAKDGKGESAADIMKPFIEKNKKSDRTDHYEKLLKKYPR